METQGIKLLAERKSSCPWSARLMQKAQMRTFICLPYLSLLQHQKSEQYYKHGLISNLKPFGGKYPPVFSDGGQGGYL